MQRTAINNPSSGPFDCIPSLPCPDRCSSRDIRPTRLRHLNPFPNRGCPASCFTNLGHRKLNNPSNSVSRSPNRAMRYISHGVYLTSAQMICRGCLLEQGLAKGYPVAALWGRDYSNYGVDHAMQIIFRELSAFLG